MNRCLFFTFAICTLLASNVSAQGFFEQLGREFRDQGRQAIEQEFGIQPRNPQQPEDTPQYKSNSLPSESGRDSGGRDFIDSGDFALPGGGQPIQPGFTDPGLVRPWQPTQPRQPIYSDGRHMHQNDHLVYPDNRIQPGRTIYTQPTSTSFRPSDVPGSPVATNQYVVIRCPQSAGGSINYLLSSNRGRYRFTLSAGQEQRFRVETNWTISYNNGTEEKRYRIDAGKVYSMKLESGNRWQLYASTPAGS